MIIDRFWEEDPPNRDHDLYTCDNRHNAEGRCFRSIKGTRYKCAHCRDYNICEICMELWMDTPSERMINSATRRGHHKWHVLVAIQFPQ